MVNGLNIIIIILSLVPTVVNCKEAAAHLQPPKPTPCWICLLTRIWTVPRIWDKIKVVLGLGRRMYTGRRNYTGRETGMLAQTLRVQSTRWRGEHRPTGCRWLLKEIRKVANLAGWVCLCPQPSELRCHNSPAGDVTGSCNILAGVKNSWSVISSFRHFMIHSIQCETPSHTGDTWGLLREPW